MPPPPDDSSEIAALARGGRTSFFGFLLRLAARLPFLFIAGQLYGATQLGRFAYATMVVELMAQLATLGLKRGLAAALAGSEEPDTHVVWDALVLAWVLALIGAGLLALFPTLIFPKDIKVTGLDQLIPLTALAIVGSDVSLAALAYRLNVAAQVRARSIVEPWTLTLLAAALAFTHFNRDGLILAYAASMAAALAASLKPLLAEFGWPHGWRPHPERLAKLARDNVPLAGADAIEWGSRRVDLFLLGFFAEARAVGVYYVAQQVATLAQKLKTSFDPVLAPVLSNNIAGGDRTAVAAHVRQVGFWIIAAQLGVALALGLTGDSVLGLVGSEFMNFPGGALTLGILLGAEVIAATGAVSESALVYTSPNRNLILSLLGIGTQVAATILLAPAFAGVGAAAGLAIGLTVSSAGKAALLRAQLGSPVVGWRWALILAAAGGAAAGLAVHALRLAPIWHLALGIPAILGVYGAIIWYRGFRDADRLLFARRKLAVQA